ncbi:DNA translocase FtsK [Ornithinibacillus scapharcae]|uniref:DNA translocase FtsK n=1 Tax=Ornithinibacillus scapharcae TaxID=1147159 RepID=UPI000225ADE5
MDDSNSNIEDENINHTLKSAEMLEESRELDFESNQYSVIQETKQQQSETSTVQQSSPSITRSEYKKDNSVPFNVIMTPTDKRKLMERNREQKVPVTQSHKEMVSKSSQSNVNVKSEHGNIPLHLLNDPIQKSNLNDQWISEQQQLLEQTLKHFHVRARVVNATQGPAVTRFEVHPELGVKVSKVKNLSDDLKLNMSAQDIRIEAPIPGKNTIGIEVPNPKSQMVSLQEILDTDAFQSNSSLLTIALGLNIEGAPVITNIQKMPHGLIAGATGSGKSVCINTILLSLIYKAHHEDVKFLLIDPKMVELAPYNGIPHLVSPVITDVKAATAALKWAVNEMEDRYERFVQEGVRDIERYNQRVIGQGRQSEKMPFIVIVIDELADLMMVSPQDVEDAISRIAQKARACGIHLLLATQRPSVDVLTGLIKANIPTRIAFSVSSQIDSRTIIDSGGAEKLLGKGDMLFVENGAGKSVRLQGPFVSDEEIERVTSYVRSIAEPHYLFEQESLLKQFVADEEEDELLEEAIQFIFHQNSASTSLLQRHFKIGYNRAARLMDALENKGIISGQNGSKPRDVLITKTELEDILS